MSEKWQDQIPKDYDPGMSPGQAGTTMFPTTPGISSGPVPWNKEMMQLLMDVPIPDEIMQDPTYHSLWLWTKRILVHMSLTGLSSGDRNRLRKDLEYILILAQQEGSEVLCAQRQLMFIADLELSKSVPDPQHGIRERLAWIMTVAKNIFGDDAAQRPGEHKAGLNIPFFGGR